MHPEALIYFTSDHSIGAPGLYPYGLCMGLGIILCFIFLLITMWKKKFNDTASDTILIIGICGTGFGIFAAMLFQSFYNYLANPEAGFHLGGMTFIGGLIGGVVSFLGVYFLYMYVVRPRTKIRFLNKPMTATLSDALPFIPVGICIAHAFGRLGCFFAGCCYGMETDAWYGLPCSSVSDATVVPTQLFEMIFLLVLGGIMALLYFKRRFNYNFSVYLIAYGIWRFLIEFVRDDARGELVGAAITPSQFWSILMVALGVGYIFLQKYVIAKHMKNPDLPAAPKPAENENA